ncbi:MAG: hypothetical protein V7637_5880 [Mycobacteriales bacterium]
MTAVRDDELLAELRALFAELDPPDPVLVEQARMAFSWRTIDADLAELAYDSLADREVLAAVRDGGPPGTGPRLLGFGTELAGEDDGLAVEVEVSAERGGPVLVGQLMPPTPATVTVHRFAGAPQPAAVVPADDLGRFRIDPVPPGPVRLRIDTGERVIETAWVSYVPLAS